MTRAFSTATVIFFGLIAWVASDARLASAQTVPASAPSVSDEQVGRASVTPSTQADRGSGNGVLWLRRLLVVVVGIAAAAACLMKAGYAPAGMPSGDTSLARERLSAVGLVSVALGAIFLLWGLVIYGLITNLAIIAAGLYAGMDWLVARGIASKELAERVRPLGVPIGLVCAGLVIVSLLGGLIGIPLYLI